MPSASGDGPGRTAVKANPQRNVTYSNTMGGSARRGPWRSTRVARKGVRTTIVPPKTAMTTPAVV
ncbi:hypothetical protein a10_08882 [Streptomyces acidiscabies]|nr:hypothetical protein a10_08882 [Streptomyces acidiscabies]GAV45897.1 hypothetical protein Saa2_08897 [Streptomyces acidiscabies]